MPELAIVTASWIARPMWADMWVFSGMFVGDCDTGLRGMVATTGANRNTIKAHLRQLVDSHRLKRRGRGRGSWYEPG